MDYNIIDWDSVIESVLHKAHNCNFTQLCVSVACLALATLITWSKFCRTKSVPFKWDPPIEISSNWKGQVLEHPNLHAHLRDPSLLPSETQATSQDYLTNYDPATGYWLGTVKTTTIQDVDIAVERAAIAQKEWAKTSFEQRRIVMKSLLDWVLRETETLARVCARDSGKTLLDAAFGEILTTAEKLSWLISNGEQYLVPEKRPTNLLLCYKTASVHYEPLGVVSAVVSWNYPAHNLLSPIIASIFAGNAIVVKPSEYVAFTSHHISRAIKSCLEACGHNPNLVQVLEACEAESASHLTNHALVKHMTFIGGECVGRKVASQMGAKGAATTLELGGKDPAIVLESTDLEYFIHTFLRGSFQSSNQNCIGMERILVHEGLYDRFIQSIEPRVKCIQLGSALNSTQNRVDMGAMISDSNFDKLEQLIDGAIKQGAKLLVGGKRLINQEFPNGHYFQPTLLVDVTPRMEISQTELFAPIMTIMKFANKEEAVQLANSSRYGLGASVFGRDLKECEWVTKRLECGMVSINDFGVFYLAQSLPFGGAKASGFGRFSGPEGLRALCNVKAVAKDRLHGYVQTAIPPRLRYPFPQDGIVDDPPASAWRFVRALIHVIYNDSWSERIQGVKDLIF